MSDISIIDYGVGNVLSIQRAFEHVGAACKLISKPEEVVIAKRIVLPGVGAFKKGMEELEKRNLVGAIQDYCDNDRPFMGICLGMQMLFDNSEEGGINKGLGIISGRVKKINNISADGGNHKVPHIGWNKLHFVNDTINTVMQNTKDGASVYFVHAYTAYPEDESNRIADTYYGGYRLSAVVKKGNVYGFQFHPEKSGLEGLGIINQFMHLT